MDWLHYVVAVLFVLLGAGCLVLVVIQLPGTWIMLGAAGVIEIADGLWFTEPRRWSFGLWALGIAVAFAAVGELLEFVAGVFGARSGGATRRGMWGALIGGIAGAFVFTPLFFFVPLFGSLLGAILGTFVGAVVGELGAEQATLHGSMRPALGATVGRVLGTAGKLGTAIGAWVVLSVALFV